MTKQSLRWGNILFIAPFLFLLILLGCHQEKQKKGSPLSPKAALKHFQLEDGLDIKLVASEPLVQAPVAMRIDAKGRMWVAEMQGYMPDTSGTDETSSPTGKIVILEDTDRDGKMDTRKIFMDSLILPRALCFYDDGVLIAEPPKLWFVKINGDTAGHKYVVDDEYAVGGNPEHQPNGLLRGLDNWVYSAKSDVRYRKKNGGWVKEHTHFRGQWGITQDDYGRLFYNNNSVNLLGDYFLPGLGAWNEDQGHVSGFNETIVKDTRTYPIHSTPGVNRGYREGVLDSSFRLRHLTAASGPVIYRGHLLGKKYKGNAFVAAPAANLVKRDILSHDGFKVSGKQAYQGKEFLASDDERFRPVSLYNGPEGALYIVDMYRGIIQDITYLTSYLKDQISKRNLAQPLNRGRIYKILPDGKTTTIPLLYNKSPQQWIDLLDSPNPWIRKTVQRLLIDQNKVKMESLLRKKLNKDASVLGKIHSFWTLEGLGRLTNNDILSFLHSENIKLQQQAIAEVVSIIDKRNVDQWLKEGERLIKEKNKRLAPYIGFLGAKAMHYDVENAQKLLAALALEYADDKYVVDAAISGIKGGEKNFFSHIKGTLTDSNLVLYTHLKKVVNNAEERRKEKQKKHGERYEKGKKLFATYCQICHGEDGAGIRALGAPLNGSQWVEGDKKTLLAIVLNGLTGPIKVGDKVYKKPEIGGEMPGFAENKKLSDEDISQILSYIRTAWNNDASAVHSKEVKASREKFSERTSPFTMKELEERGDL